MSEMRTISFSDWLELEESKSVEDSDAMGFPRDKTRSWISELFDLGVYQLLWVPHTVRKPPSIL
jgi:hypothetical protein